MSDRKGGICGLQKIIDGTSNTIAFGEWRMGDGIQTKVSIPSDVVFIGNLPSGTARNNGTLNMPNPALVASFLPWMQTCTSSLTTARTNHTSSLGEAWIFNITGFCFGNVLLPPNPEVPQLRLV